MTIKNGNDWDSLEQSSHEYDRTLTVTLIMNTLTVWRALGDRTNDRGHRIRNANRLKGG